MSLRILLAGCSLAALTSPVLAQTAPSAPDAPSSTRRSATDDAVNSADIVVTGSRVITNGNNSPTPVTVVTTAQLAQSTPSNIPDALNKLPVFSLSRSQASLGSANNNFSGNYLNLRGVGILRTLVLFDGHRVPSTAQDGSIDTNTIPQLLIQRVDVVTGGASAVYGSDAVTGVVNFVVDKNFKGIKAFGQGGLSSRNDDGSLRYGVAGGASVMGGRGHIEASYEYYNSNGLPSKLLRKTGLTVYGEQGGGSAANPFHLVPNTRNALIGYGGYILNVRDGAGNVVATPVTGQQFVGVGVIGPFVHGTPTGSAGIESGGDGSFNFNSSLLAYLRSHQGYARFDYDLTDNFAFYTQASGTISRNGTNFSPLSYAGVVLSVDDPYLPAAARAQFPASASTFTLNKVVRQAQPNRVIAKVTNIFSNTGITGKLFSNFTGDISYTHAVSTTRVAAGDNISTGRLYAALDAVTAPGGQIVCRVTLTNPGLYPGCVPLNPFGPNSEDPAAIRYFRQDTHLRLTNKLDDFSGSVSGSPFNTWAGPVKMAVSGEYRRLRLDNVSDAQPTARLNCTGLRFNCNANSVLFTQSIVADAHARQRVAEGAVELNVPLLTDVRFFRALEVNGAARYTNYTTSGSAWTWKVGANWRVNDEVSFRATRSQDIRAPTLNDLFAPVNASPTGFTDFHTNTSGTIQTQSQGNPNLVPEVAQTLTVGGVFRPSWLPRFSLAVDFYRIHIARAITTVGGNDAATQTQCENSGGTSPLCALYVRPLPFDNRTSANYPTLILTQGLNVSSVKTHGIDTEMNYNAPVAGGLLSLRGLLSYQPKLVTVQFPGAVPIDAAGAAGLPSWKFTAFVRYDINGFAIDVQERWHSSTLQSGNPQLVYLDPKVPAASFTDLTLSYLLKRSGGQAEVFLSIQNLFDKTAPIFAGTNFSSNPGFAYPATNGDDVIGRYFTAGVRFKF